MQHSNTRDGEYLITEIVDRVERILPEYGSFDRRYEAEIYLTRMHPDMPSDEVHTRYNVVNRKDLGLE